LQCCKSETLCPAPRRPLVVERDDLPLYPRELERLAAEVALGAVQQLLHLVVVACDARQRQPRALPQLVVVDLGYRGSEALLELRLGRLDVPALALQRARLREMELDRENPDVAGAHGRIDPGATKGCVRASNQACGSFSACSARPSSRSRPPARIGSGRSDTPIPAAVTPATSSCTAASRTCPAGTATPARRRVSASTT